MLSTQKKLAMRDAAGHRLDPVHAGARVEHHVAGRQLDALRAVGVLDHQLAAVVFVGLGEEQRAADVGAHPLAGPPGT